MNLRVTCATLLLSVAGGLAQESRGTIGGRVVDPQDAAIAQARVVITNVETGVSSSIQTNEQGAYIAPLLIPGKYQVVGSHAGFKKFQQNGIQLGVNDNLQIDIKLEVGEVTQTVDVVASAPLIQAADASMG